MLIKIRFFKGILPLTLAALLVLALAACSGKPGDPAKTPSPTSSPRPTAAASASPEASAPPSPEASDSAGPSAEASLSPGASERTGSVAGLENFVEGSVVDPKDVPELTALLLADERYRDMSIQSVTYRTFEERKAFYVVLQGDGEASHPVYVFEDGTIRDEGM